MNLRVEKEINHQISVEFYSAHLYLSMSAYLSSINLPGFANWMRVQFEEEQAHALKLYDYMVERGGNVIIKPIEKPKAKWANIIEVFEDVFEHEKMITGLINELTSIAQEEKDYASVNLLQWFVTEQVEEESSVSEILEQLKLIEGQGSGLFILDREGKERTFNPITK